jgi:hypothetical protein
LGSPSRIITVLDRLSSCPKALGVEWQHAFEEKYRNKNSTTIGVAAIRSKELKEIKPGRQKKEQHDRDS